MVWYEGILREVTERRASVATLMDRIVAVLVDGPMSATTIADGLNEGLPKPEHTSANAIRSVLSRELKRGASSRVSTSDGRVVL